MGGMPGDILETIDETLAWYGSDDSYCWHAAVFPVLSAFDRDVARQLSADTGMDGYAAWLAVAEVRDRDGWSPWLDEVHAAGLTVRERGSEAQWVQPRRAGDSIDAARYAINGWWPDAIPGSAGVSLGLGLALGVMP